MSVYEKLSHRLCMMGCCLMIFNVHVGQLIAQMDNDVMHVKSLKALPRRASLTDLGLFLNSDHSLLVFCSSADFSDNSKSKIFVFSQQQDNSWYEEEKNCVGIVSKIISDGKFRLVTYDNYSRETQNLFEVYDVIEDLKIADNPKLSLNLYSTEKFKNEGSKRIISVAAGDRPDSFLVLGKYSASNLNLFTLWPRIASAGHAGIVDIPFAIQITEGKVTGFYNLQTKFQDREYVSDIQGVTEGRIVHITWIKGRNYGPDTPKIMYAQFDLNAHQWSDVTELFRGTKFKSKIVRYFREPSVLLLGENLHCAWANANTQDDRGKPLDKPLASSGVFYRGKDKNGWSSIYKVSNCEAGRCKLAAGKDGKIHLFWIDYQKKVYHAYQDETGWQDATVIYEDPDMNWTLPFDIKIDQTGNFHMLYVRRISYVSPCELIYVKIIR